MKVCAFMIALSLLGVGCRSAPTKPVPKPEQPVAVEPEVRLNEMLREGAFQMNAASEGLQDALNACLALLKKEKSGSEKYRHLDEIVSLVDEAGSLVSDHTAAPPSIDAIKQQFAKFDDQRLLAIADGNSALQRLDLATRHCNALGESNPVQELSDLIGLAQDEIEGSIGTLGGVVEAPLTE